MKRTLAMYTSDHAECYSNIIFYFFQCYDYRIHFPIFEYNEYCIILYSLANYLHDVITDETFQQLALKESRYNDQVD
jgi:hypothetical protein